MVRRITRFVDLRVSGRTCDGQSFAEVGATDKGMLADDFADNGFDEAACPLYKAVLPRALHTGIARGDCMELAPVGKLFMGNSGPKSATSDEGEPAQESQIRSKAAIIEDADTLSTRTRAWNMVAASTAFRTWNF